jgi:hypothetical protein
MGNLENRYAINEHISPDEVSYIFLSQGNNNIVKVVQYSYISDFESGFHILELQNKKHFNFGFGDFDVMTSNVADTINTNNGDMYRVFNTVLSTVQLFFQLHPNAVISVQGSDSSDSFTRECRKYCKRKCGNVCKKQHQRISIYRNYIARHLAELENFFLFFGGYHTSENIPQIEVYQAQKEYAILLILCKNV